eukprot:11604614-Karenia_brevis.AAC.1
MQLTGLDPELRNTGGVGVIARKTRCYGVTPLTDDMRDLIKMGRANMTSIPIPQTILLVTNVYGWTNGHLSGLAADRTDDMMSIIFNELHAQPQCPVLIIGDLNATTQDLPTLHKKLQDGDYVDLGAH